MSEPYYLDTWVTIYNLSGHVGNNLQQGRFSKVTIERRTFGGKRYGRYCTMPNKAAKRLARELREQGYLVRLTDNITKGVEGWADVWRRVR